MSDVPTITAADADSPHQVVLPAGLRWHPIGRVPLVMNHSSCAPEPPDPYRPSLAISVAEDPAAPADCTITSYIKVTLTVAGWRLPSGGQQDNQQLPGPSVWGCYGARLQLAVNPVAQGLDEADFPVFTDFEPQMRDLFQGGTIENEVVSGSSGQTTVDRASKSISSTTLGLSVTAGYGPGGQATGSSYGSISATGSISGTRSLEQDYDFSTVSGASTNKRNTTTDTVSQLFNLLTGYHSGTNCLSIEMYPRPHTAQPEFGPLADFTPGLRAIEGIQEVIAVVSRRNDDAGRAGLTFTAWLDLVHVSPLLAQPTTSAAPPSRLLPDPHWPDQPLLLHFDTQGLRRSYPAPRWGDPPTPDDVAEYTQLFDIRAALDSANADIDLSAGDSPSSPGVTMFRSYTPRHDQERIGSERYGAVSNSQIRVNVVQRPDIGVGEAVPQIVKDYAVWVKDRTLAAPSASVQGNLEHRRLSLCVSYAVRGECIERLPTLSDGIGGLIASFPLHIPLPTMDAAGAHYVGRTLIGSVKGVLALTSTGKPSSPKQPS